MRLKGALLEAYGNALYSFYGALCAVFGDEDSNYRANVYSAGILGSTHIANILLVAVLFGGRGAMDSIADHKGMLLLAVAAVLVPYVALAQSFLSRREAASSEDDLTLVGGGRGRLLVGAYVFLSWIALVVAVVAAI